MWSLGTEWITDLVYFWDALHLKLHFFKYNIESNKYCFHSNISVLCFLDILLLQLAFLHSVDSWSWFAHHVWCHFSATNIPRIGKCCTIMMSDRVKHNKPHVTAYTISLRVVLHIPVNSKEPVKLYQYDISVETKVGKECWKIVNTCCSRLLYYANKLINGLQREKGDPLK